LDNDPTGHAEPDGYLRPVNLNNHRPSHKSRANPCDSLAWPDAEGFQTINKAMATADLNHDASLPGSHVGQSQPLLISHRFSSLFTQCKMSLLVI